MWPRSPESIALRMLHGHERWGAHHRLALSHWLPHPFSVTSVLFLDVFLFLFLTFLAVSFRIGVSLLDCFDKCMPRDSEKWFLLRLGLCSCFAFWVSLPSLLKYCESLRSVSMKHESDLGPGGLHIWSLFERNLPCVTIDMSSYDANMYLTLAEGNRKNTYWSLRQEAAILKLMQF